MAAKKTPRSKTPTPRKPTPGITVKVDAKLKKTYDALVAVIGRSSRTEMEDFDRRWEAAGAIVDHDPPLYVVGGHRNAAEFYRAVMKEEPRTAARYVRVARYASPRDEQTYGVAKLDAALGYIEAKLGKPLAHPPLPVSLDRLRIPTAEGASKSLESATFAELVAATGKLTEVQLTGVCGSVSIRYFLRRTSGRSWSYLPDCEATRESAPHRRNVIPVPWPPRRPCRGEQRLQRVPRGSAESKRIALIRISGACSQAGTTVRSGVVVCEFMSANMPPPTPA